MCIECWYNFFGLFEWSMVKFLLIWKISLVSWCVIRLLLMVIWVVVNLDLCRVLFRKVELSLILWWLEIKRYFFWGLRLFRLFMLSVLMLYFFINLRKGSIILVWKFSVLCILFFVWRSWLWRFLGSVCCMCFNKFGLLNNFCMVVCIFVFFNILRWIFLLLFIYVFCLFDDGWGLVIGCLIWC